MSADPLLLGIGVVVGGALRAWRRSAGGSVAGACVTDRYASSTGGRPWWSLASAVTLAALLVRWPETQDRVVLGIYLGALMVLAATDLDQKLLARRHHPAAHPVRAADGGPGSRSAAGGQGPGARPALSPRVSARRCCCCSPTGYSVAHWAWVTSSSPSASGLMPVCPGCWRGSWWHPSPGRPCCSCSSRSDASSLRIGHPVRAHPHRRRGHRALLP